MLKSVVNLVVQIILVVAGVLVFAFFDPFGLLSPKKKTLEDTPVTVASIREIGQLITAEYYGEVLSSLQDELIEEVKASSVETTSEFKKLNLLYLQALREFYQRKDNIPARWYSRRKDLVAYFYEANPAIANNVFYQDMIGMVLENFTTQTNGGGEKKYSDEGDLLLDMWKEKRAADKFETEFVTKCIVPEATFASKKEQEITQLTSTKAFKKRQIIVLGRGLVRAGIDFGKFTERNFKYDREHRTVYLLGVVPSILDCDINPWFIPEQKVKGFEIIAATNKANDPDYLVKVKTSCLNKLRAQAENNGIITHAKINAEESLKHLLSLLLNEPIDEVKIMENPIDAFNDLFSKDKIIPKERLALLDSLLESISKLSYDTAFKKIGALSTLKWDTSLKALPVNRYTHFSQRISEDELLSGEEWKKLTEEFGREKFSTLDSVWFFSPENYRKEAASAKARLPDSIKYDSDKEFWLDSLLFTKDYKEWETAFNNIRKADAWEDMREKRKTARAASIDFLKSKVSTIKFGSNDVENNNPLLIKARLDSLKSK